MTHILDSESIATPAGTYTVEFIHDESADEPYDEGFSIHVSETRDTVGTDAGDRMPALVAGALTVHARRPDRDDHWRWEFRSGAAIVRYMRLLGYRGVTLIDDYQPDEPTANRYDRVEGIAWAPADVPPESADEYVRGNLAEWHAWSEGGTFGYRILDPSGAEIESCWGFYGLIRERDYVLGVARWNVDHHASDNVDRANMVGAGFVGII